MLFEFCKYRLIPLFCLLKTCKYIQIPPTKKQQQKRQNKKRIKLKKNNKKKTNNDRLQVQIYDENVKIQYLKSSRLSECSL